METKKRPTYDKEFRDGSVAQVLDQKRTPKDVAKSLGIHESTLRNWVTQAKIDRAGGTSTQLSTEERAEFAQLKRDYKRVVQERDILKKATAFFAMEESLR
jgi:transposase